MPVCAVTTLSNLGYADLSLCNISLVVIIPLSITLKLVCFFSLVEFYLYN